MTSLVGINGCFDGQAKKDLSSHCDQIVMSLATLNKQRTLEKQPPQSIKTTVTISSVSKTTAVSSSPFMTAKNVSDTASVRSEPSIASSDSQQTVREASMTPEANGKPKEKFMSDDAVKQRRGKLKP